MKDKGGPKGLKKGKKVPIVLKRKKTPQIHQSNIDL